VVALIPLAVLLLLPTEPWAWAAFLLFCLAALTDWLDGWAARKFNLITDFGKLADALTDKIFMVGSFFILVDMPGFLPEWTIFLVLIILTREFLVTGLRMVAASRGLVLPAERGGKIKTACQMVAAGALLLALAWPDGGFESGVWWLGLALYVVSTVLTAHSGWVYFKRYQQSNRAEEATTEPPLS